MKRNSHILSLIFTLILIATMATGCGRNSLGSTADSGASSGGGGGTAGESSNSIVIKIAHTDSEIRSVNVAALEFKEYMEKETDGRVIVEVYPNGQLGDDEEVIKGIKLGTCQIHIGTQGVLSGLLGPQLDIFDLPYLYEDIDSWYTGSFEKGGLELYNEQLAPSGYVCLYFEYDGMRNVLSAKNPIRTLEDIKGTKIRANNNELYLSYYQAIGANPTPMTFGEVYTGLTQGTIDAVDHVPGVMVDQKFYEPGKYFTKSDHMLSPLIVLSSQDFVNSLPDDIREIFMTGIQQMAETQIALEIEAEKAAISTMAENGVEIIELAPEERAKWAEAAQPIYDKWRGTVGDELIDKVLEIAGR